MAPKLVTALLVRNEADKYLERVLTRCLEFSDDVIVVDDGSTDGSDRLAWRLGCTVHYRTGQTMWGNESPARAELWEIGAKAAGDGWLLIADADMLLHGDPRPLTLSTTVNSWGWPLFDMWTDRYYRADGFWQGHLHSRPWMYRPNSLRSDPPIWAERGIHCGHAPANFPYQTGFLNNYDYYWIHQAFDTPALRRRKFEQYMAKADQLSPFELAHASSIMDA